MSSPPLLTLPPTQNTAPVLEFRCLYTQDVRRKQKRWQDGRLKFHTFNKRVMVYDERSNFVGDSHWREDSDFNEGEELELERGGILVEVGECVGKKDQDLSELVDKRVKEKEGRAAAKAAQSATLGPRASLAQPHMPTSVGVQQLRPKPLNAVLGVPSGHYGRAVVSNLSPFEQKHSSNQDDHINGRPAKRQKQNATPTKSGYAQNLLGATLTLGSTRPSNTQTIRYEPLKASICRPQTGIIDLKLDENGYGVMSGDKIDEGIQNKRSAKMQKRSSSRKPHSSGGYASSLSGASLTLSGPKAFASANSANNQTMAIKAAVSPYQDGKPGTSTYRTKITAKPTIESMPLDGLDITNQHLSSSTLISELPILKVTEKPTTGHKNKPTQTPHVRKLIAEQVVTPLRIKPRPPRKLMMLMELSRPRQPAPDMDAEGGKELSVVSNLKEGAGMGIIPGTEDGTKTKPHAPLHTAENDTIELEQPENSSLLHGTEPLPQQAIGLEQPRSSSLLHKPEVMLQKKTGPGEAFEPFLPKPHVTVGDNSLAVTDEPSNRSQSPSIHENFDAPDELMAVGTDLEFILNEDTVSTVWAVGQPQNAPQPLHTDVVPATNCCRQSPDTSVRSDKKASLHLGATKEREKSGLDLDRSFTSRETEIDISETVIKPSPASSTIATFVDQVDYSGQTVENEMSSITLPRGRLINPTTVRSSVKATTSRIINARIPGANFLPGTAPPPSAKIETIDIKEDTGLRGPGREKNSRGPWSRESFDLFGTWRPPARAANLNL